ncbi:MAG: hypothetical protein AAB614_02025 [Patescibacteria group bacterium]
MNNSKKIILIFLVVIIFSVFTLYFFINIGGKSIYVSDRKIVVQESPKVLDTKSISIIDGKIPNKDAYNIKINPKNEIEKVVVPNAILTLKDSYLYSLSEALKWSKDAKLVFIKSYGTLTLEGKSSQWQIIFSSKNKKKGYEIIIEKDFIFSKKEVESSGYGYDLPKNWYDAKDAIISIQTMPQFSESTLSGISFVYNIDGKIWSYALATSNGTVSIPVR